MLNIITNIRCYHSTEGESSGLMSVVSREWAGPGGSDWQTAGKLWQSEGGGGMVTSAGADKLGGDISMSGVASVPCQPVMTCHLVTDRNWPEQIWAPDPGHRGDRDTR